MWRILFKRIVHLEKLKLKDRFYIVVFNFLRSLEYQVKLGFLDSEYSAKF